MLLWCTTDYIGDEHERNNFLMQVLQQKFGLLKLSYVDDEESQLQRTSHAKSNSNTHEKEKRSKGIRFASFPLLLDYVTVNYDKLFMIEDIYSLHDLNLLRKRPFFCHIHVDLPLNLRFDLYKQNFATTNPAEKSLPLVADFQQASLNADSTNNKKNNFDNVQTDFLNFVNKESHYHTTRKVLLLQNYNALLSCVPNFLTSPHSSANTQDISTIFSNFSTQVEELLKNSKFFKCPRGAPPLRPSWDQYFMKLANLAASRSNCMKRKVGCCIVQDSRIIATGYNGTPRHLKNCFDGGCERCNSGNSKNLHTCLCLHAEENALLEAGRSRIAEKDCILYCDTCPCVTCSVKIVQTGITEVVYSQSYSMDEQSFKIFQEGHVKVRQYKHQESDTLIYQVFENSYKECF
ncbi:hypothetical protein ACO0QE_001016 [Hanseniaspora vineae]